MLVEPVGECFVELGSGLLGERVVGGVADQEVAKAECLLVGVRRLVRADHLLADEGEEVAGRRRRARRSAPARCTVLRWKTCPSTAPRPIMSRSPGPSRSRRDCRSAWIVGGTTISPLLAVLAHGSEHLLDEERVSVGGGQDASRARRRRAAPRPRAARSAARNRHRTAPRAGSSSRSACRRPSPVAARAARAARRRAGGSARRATSRQTCSIRSRKTGSAHWMSSTTRICGRAAARRLDQLAESELRVAGRGCRSPLPGSTPIASRISTSGQ